MCHGAPDQHAECAIWVLYAVIMWYYVVSIVVRFTMYSYTPRINSEQSRIWNPGQVAVQYVALVFMLSSGVGVRNSKGGHVGNKPPLNTQTTQFIIKLHGIVCAICWLYFGVCDFTSENMTSDLFEDLIVQLLSWTEALDGLGEPRTSCHSTYNQPYTGL